MENSLRWLNCDEECGKIVNVLDLSTVNLSFEWDIYNVYDLSSTLSTCHVHWKSLGSDMSLSCHREPTDFAFVHT